MYSQLYSQVLEWIPEKSRVLDLGTGDGEFLARLVREKHVHGEGVEKDPKMVTRCIEHGLVVHQGDIFDGLDQYGTGAFDYVLLLGTFQELYPPQAVVQEAFRVGRRVIISYGNFGYVAVRLQMLMEGRSPVTKTLPEPWYLTRNLRFFSVSDFKDFCRATKIKESAEAYFNARGRVLYWPNLLADQALAMLEPDGIAIEERK